ncbi:hypothetical protein [Kitasatospora sp. MBT63]|uniref:hypothetical protein n=1 Tax=Kitasatospora sp. MBT63 TaxID=1444768 RepID=UPI00053A5845|nr:hypothetical protein [Kitasatospora sp. MBT63]
MVPIIIAGEIGFWVLLALALAARYLLRWRTASTVLLIGLPLTDLVILATTVHDLRSGAVADWSHGLAAAYAGFSVGYGHALVRRADAHAAHRFAGGERPARPPKYGRERAAHEWRIFGRTLVAAVVTVALIAGVQWLAGDAARTAGLDQWYPRMAAVTGISLLIAASYTLFPKRERG